MSLVWKVYGIVTTTKQFLLPKTWGHYGNKNCEYTEKWFFDRCMVTDATYVMKGIVM